MNRFEELTKYCKENGIMLFISRTTNKVHTTLKRGNKSCSRSWSDGVDNIGFKECLEDAKRMIRNENEENGKNISNKRDSTGST